METLIQLFTNLGTAGLSLFWLPIAIWTVFAVAAVIVLHLFEHKISAVYQYHSRVALLWGLITGVAGSALLYYFSFGSTGEAGLSTKFIVIQNPISVTTSAPEALINWSEPILWLGIVTALVLFSVIASLLKLATDFNRLKVFSRNLHNPDADLKPELSETNRRRLDQNHISISFSDEVAVPCTFGWRRKHIVLPQNFSAEPDKLNMALRHELTHISNNDYLINFSVQIVKSLFFFHPLVYRLISGIEEYREIYCDQHVLADATVSQKNYAQLLLELSPKTVFKMTAAVNMAVDPSTLKKRIQTMTTSNHSLPSMKWSLSLMLVLTLMLTGLMACSDIEEGGITNSEVQEVQANIDKAPSGDQPLYLVNGEKEDKSILSRLKPKYIESINVLKGEKAKEKYGEAGKNGVVSIKLIEKEKAFSDLLTDAEIKAKQNSVKKSDQGEYYISVENPPKIKGGMQSVMKKVRYPKECKDAGIEGRVIVQFIISKQGKAENPQVIRGIGGGCDEEALLAVKQTEFEPGMQDGKPVRVQMSLPIMFKL